MNLRHWEIKAPYVWQGKRNLLKFRVQARDREQAALFARAIIKDKCPIQIDAQKFKMVRV